MGLHDLGDDMRKRASAPTNEPTPKGAASLDMLYRQHAKEISAFVARTFGAGPPDPEDAVQASFAQFAALEDPSSVRNPRAFLFRSARNYVIDYRRRQLTQRRYASEMGEGLDRLRRAGPHAGAAESFTEPPTQDDPHRVLEGKERLAAVSAAVRTLEPRRRKVLIWHALHELTFNEIAHRMGVSQARVRQLFAEAIAACEAATRKLDAGEDGGQ